ncbi:MAG: thioesterase family protein [Alphaproteobacteria bacterium]|nr:thioesterase family protein [Alphaproteobacteria bacterium]
MPFVENGETPELVDGWLRWKGELARVKREWCDSNNHLNMGFYLVIFDYQTDRLWPFLNIGKALRARGLTTFAVESWLDYQREMLEPEPLGAESRVLDFDAKRLMVEHRMFHHTEGWTTSMNEVLYLCVDVATRKVAPWPEDVLARFAAVAVKQEARRLTMKRRA